MSRIDPFAFQKGAAAAGPLMGPTPLEREAKQAAIENVRAQMQQRLEAAQKVKQEAEDRETMRQEAGNLQRLAQSKQGEPLTVDDFLVAAPRNGQAWAEKYFKAKGDQDKASFDKFEKIHGMTASHMNSLLALPVESRAAAHQEFVKQITPFIGEQAANAMLNEDLSDASLNQLAQQGMTIKEQLDLAKQKAEETAKKHAEDLERLKLSKETVETAEGVMQFSPKTGAYDTRVGSVKTPASAETPHTTTTEEGVFQWNPQTRRYDIRVGSRPRPAGSATATDLNDDVQAYVDSLAAGELQPANVPQKIRGKVLATAQKQGVSILSDKEREAISGLDTADTILADISKYSKKIHTEEGVGARTGGLYRRGAAYFGYDADVKSLQSKAGELSLLIRALGEKGALAEGDVTRALKLVPTDPGLTKTEAQNMLNDLAGIFKNVRNQKLKSATGTFPRNTDKVDKGKSDPLGIRE